MHLVEQCSAAKEAAVRDMLCFAVSAVLMIGIGGWRGGQIMPRVQLPATTPKHRAWNKGRIIGQKRPLLPRQVWAIRARLELAGNLRDLALFNVAIDSKLRGCDLIELAINGLVKDECVRERVSVIPSNKKRQIHVHLRRRFSIHLARHTRPFRQNTWQPLQPSLPPKMQDHRME